MSSFSGHFWKRYRIGCGCVGSHITQPNKTKENTPWFVYFNPTRMHVWTHLKPESQGKTGHGIYPDGMVELDGYVGQLLKKLDDLGIADNTIVVFTTDNGAEVMSWPDGGTTPFRGEKATNWEGGYRVPTVIRWPGIIKPDTVYNDVFSHYDLIPTFAAAGGNPNIVEQVRKGAQIGDKTFKVHLDGYNLMPFFKGEAKDPRREFLYWNDDGELVAIRINDWKIVFKEQDHKGIGVWQNGTSRICACRNCSSSAPIRSSAATSRSFTISGWLDRAFVQVPAQTFVAQWLQSFKEFPIRQKPASFNLDSVMEKLSPTKGPGE